MSNFWRAVLRTFKFRLLIFSSVVCVLMIGILWGGNIGAVVYPVTEICLNKRTFTSWLKERITKNEQRINELQNKSKQHNPIETKNPNTDSDNPNNNVALIDAKKITSDSNVELEISVLIWWQKFYTQALPIAEKYTPRTPFGTVVFLIVIVLVGTVIKIFFIVCHGIISARIAQHTALEIREKLFNKVINYDVSYFSQSGIADTMSRFTNDLNILTGGINAIYGKILREPFKMIVCLVIAAYLCWQLLLITMLLVPLAFVAIRWLAKSIKRVVQRSMEEIALLYGRLEETFRSIKIVQAFVQESLELTKFSKTNQACCEKAIKIAKYESLASPMTELFGILMISMGIVVGAYLVMSERTAFLGIPMLSTPMDTGSLIMFFALLAGAADPARRLSDIFTQFQSAAAAADRIYSMIDRLPQISDPESPEHCKIHHQSIKFDNVQFSYKNDRIVLKNISLEIKFGECIVIIGASGSGKSSLINLIPRFNDPTNGRVLIDDQVIANVRRNDLRNQIGLVTQEPMLFNDTVMNNIRYGDSNASRENAIEAAKKANAHEFIINELTDGYDTIIGHAGGQLSGGQRQRIALARAILKNPSILLLDEATSQIDIQSERMIHDALKEFKHGRTTIIITHRLATIDLADRIIMMEDGQIIATGTHESLLKNNPTYMSLYQ
ncbi:MAG: ABC transporter ATP-binding protein/permease [Planctomycetaceae bacterium]|jgi:ATP-binding cassette subfamily B protein/subfamily B ATP-binding cassette protein MsbA|nr:ABC transporter ATP-binding protein/permease [Planctomycetaceae bacterium]